MSYKSIVDSIIKKHGKHIIGNPKQFEGLLHDYLYNNPLQRNISIHMLHAGVLHSLKNKDQITSLEINNFIKTLHIHYGTDSTLAKELILVWANVLDLEIMKSHEEISEKNHSAISKTSPVNTKVKTIKNNTYKYSSPQKQNNYQKSIKHKPAQLKTNTNKSKKNSSASYDDFFTFILVFGLMVSMGYFLLFDKASSNTKPTQSIPYKVKTSDKQYKSSSSSTSYQSSTPPKKQNNNYKKQHSSMQTKKESIKEKIVDVLFGWNRALNSKNFYVLEPLYADRVLYYGSYKQKRVCLNDKKRALSKNPRFSQRIKKANYQKVRNSIYRVSFTKVVKHNSRSKTKYYQAYLDIDIASKKIVAEGDKTTDRNRKKASKKYDIFSNQYIKANVSYREEGDYIKFTVSATNLYRTGRGGISISFPTLDTYYRLRSKQQSGFPSINTYNKGDLVWSRISAKKIPAQYKLIEGWSDKWRKGAKKSLSFKIHRSVAKGTVIYVRALLRRKKTEYTLPIRNQAHDQQGYAVRSYRLDF